MTPRPAAGLVLAAGTSSRLADGSKLLLPFGPAPLVAAPVRAALEAGLEPVLVVAGDRAAEIRRALERTLAPGSPVRFARVSDPARGQAASLAVGISALAGDPGVSAAAVLLGDEPGLAVSAVRRVVSAWRPRGPAVRARYRDRPGHPVVFGREWFGDLARLEGDRGAAVLFRERPDALLEVSVDLEAPVDVDTRADYRRALARAGLESAGTPGAEAAAGGGGKARPGADGGAGP